MNIFQRLRIIEHCVLTKYVGPSESPICNLMYETNETYHTATFGKAGHGLGGPHPHRFCAVVRFLAFGEAATKLDSPTLQEILAIASTCGIEEKDDDMEVTAALKKLNSTKKLVKAQVTNAGVANTIEKAHGFEEMWEPRPSGPGSSTDGQ